MSLFSFLSNPATFAVFTVVAIGVIIYEIVNNQNEGGHHHGGRGSGPKGPGSNGSSPSRGSKPSLPSYDDMKSEVRNRRPISQETKIEPVKRTETKSDVRNRRPVSQETKIEPVKRTETKSDVRNQKPISQETKIKPVTQSDAKYKEDLPDHSKETPKGSKFNEEEYSKEVFDKIENDVKNFNKSNEAKKIFHKDIVSDCSASTSLDTKEIKSINTGTSRANEERHIQENTPSTSGSKGNVYNQETMPKNVNSPRSTDESTANDTDSDNSSCMACGDVFANAVNYPCKHCYLCMDCATKVHRIYKKCTICESEIEYFRELET